MKDFTVLAKQLGGILQEKNLIITTAESCTGGWVAQAITTVPGSSQWFDRSFVSYSNLAKMEMLGVQEITLQLSGAVSQEVVQEMALGALVHSPAQVSIAITGVAGPEGGSDPKPVGMVWFAWARKQGRCKAEVKHFPGDREAIRSQAVEFSLLTAIDFLGSIANAQ